jgi:hypothetical protein
MTERRRPRRPSPALVIWGSVGLFAVLFAILTYRLSASEPPPRRPVMVRKVIKRRVITTVVPTPGPSGVTSSAPAESESASPVPAAPVVTSSS